MYWTRRHVLVCTSQHCQQKGAMDVVGLLRLQVVRQKLDSEILVNNCGTIDLCDVGPNMVIYPDNIVYGGVTKADLPEIIEYLKGGPVVERLLVGPNAPAEKKRRAFYEAAVSGSPTSPAPAFTVLAEEHGFDGPWIAEQQRRGFIARKPGADGGEETITVTKKALDRYRLRD
ncbi:MAG TPA: (2Fe-2S) ferredoxin domain-containing protein [Thermomicrobiales bacterium]|jgi:(2Fe-2S) ferredoxin|nr:(2Fe-2S) ferredoxin domain-containing protein [Thermomicrobiales bacterium]